MSLNKPIGSLTEVDLIKQVALHYAKQDKGKTLEIKESAKENFRLIFRVYSAFTKLLRSQLDSKEKGIDTLYIGAFYKEYNSKKIVYLPSKDFLEAGKFKWTGEPIENIDSKIKELKEQGTVINLSHSAIGMVCSQISEQVSKILQDFFAALIEHGRQTQNEVILNLKIGYLHLFKSGEISFEYQDEEVDSNLKKKRQELREDLSVIDHASAILSQKGGKTFSIRSNFMENLSVKTPSTITSSTYHSRVLSENRSQKNDIVRVQNRVIGWDKYKKRGYQKNNSSVIHEPIKKPIDIEEQSDMNKTTSSGVPFPFLQAFMERQTGQRFGKKMKFYQPENTKDMIGFFIKQIQHRKEEEKLDKQKMLDAENQEIIDLKQMIKMEKEAQFQDKQRKRLEFLQANEQLLYEKQKKERLNQSQHFQERVNYFPFTHGDQVENQREIIKKIQQEDLKNIYKEKLAQRDFKSKQKQRGLSQDIGSEYYSSPSHYQYDFFAASGSQGFMKNQKAYAFRQRGTKHLEGAMNEALKRFEEKLKTDEKAKQKQIQDFQSKIEQEKEQFELEEKLKSDKKAQVYRDLTEQMMFNQQLKEYQQQEHFYEHPSNYGPEENEEGDQYYRNKKENDVKNMKDFLDKQVLYRQKMEDLNKSQDLKTAQEQLEIVKKNFEEEQEEGKQREKMRKNLYKEIWNEQCKLNEKTKKVEKIFN